MAESQLERDRWRHRHARDYAKPWKQPTQVVASGAIGGLFGGILTAATSSLPTWVPILAGIGGVVVAAYLPWVAVYLFSAATAGGRLMRKELHEIRQLVERPAQTPVMAAPPASAIARRATNPKLTIVEVPNSCGKSPLNGPEKDAFDLRTNVYITNEDYDQTTMIVGAHLDQAVFDGDQAIKRNKVPGFLFQMADGLGSTNAIAPRRTRQFTCQFRMTPDGDGNGGWRLPESVEGTIVILDRHNETHSADPIIWR